MVSITATATPDIAIVSPTPRTFTFPINCQLGVPDLSPVTSPSSSPFEPDLSHLSFVPPSPCETPVESSPTPDLFLSPSHRTRQLSRSLSRSPSRSHSRASSTASSSALPKKGDVDYIKRPENAFILFRRKCCEDRAAELATYKTKGGKRKPRQADLSKSISQQWKSLAPSERQCWEDLAKEKKKEHEEMHPGYVYRPQRARDKDGNVKPRRPRGSRFKELAAKEVVKAEKARLEESSDLLPTPTLNLVVPSGSRTYGRSMSLPSSREMLEIPNLYSCPTSPMKARMSAPGYGDKAYILGDEMPAMEWATARGGYAMPWGISWAPALVHCHFPNPDFAFNSGVVPLDISPCMSSPSSLPSLDHLDFPVDVTQFPSCDPFGMDIEVDFSIQPLNFASMAWEQVNPAWGSLSAIPTLDNQHLDLNTNNTTSSWGINGVPSMELGVPTESLFPSYRDDDATPSGELSL